MSLVLERRDPESLEWDRESRAALDPWLRAVGPLALIEGEVAASGRGGRSGSAMGALGVVLLDPGDPSLLAGRVRGDGLRGLRRVLAGRALVLHDGERLRARLARDVDPMLAG
ncbi:MAG: hypothetical protein R3F21_25090, partial [Myxococcota bacterium]